MKVNECGSVTVYTFEQLAPFDNLLHFVSTRKGGSSDGNFASLNLGFHVGDNDFRVLQNRRALADAVGVDLLQFTLAQQSHSANVAIVDETGRGRGAAEYETALPNTDGMVTNAENVCLGVQVADCVPILLYDPVQRVIAALHAGWKGTLRKIALAAVNTMRHNYGSRAEDIHAGLGPSNGPCCYEVGEDVYRETLMALGPAAGVAVPAKIPGKYFFDQWKANARQLKEAGLMHDRIEVAGICSQCHHDVFYSSRAGKGITGRYMAGIMLKKQRQAYHRSKRP